MKSPVQPLFLARRPYRRRRILDAARILPVFGLLGFMMPLLWSVDRSAGSQAPGLGAQAIFIFTVWFALVAAAAVAARLLRRAEAPDARAPTAKEDAGDGDRR